MKLAVGQVKLHFFTFRQAPDDRQDLFKQNRGPVIIFFSVIIQSGLVFDPPILTFLISPELTA
jgi:hypothetical protein